MSWNLPRIINNLELEIESGYVHDPATRNFSMGSYDITNINLVKCEDIETRRFFSVNDELDKLDNFEATTTNPDVTNIIGKLKIDNINTNIIYSTDELTRIELDDSDINLISQNLTWNGLDVLTTANLETLENKTFYIDGSSISPNGTIFSNYIYSDGFIINGGPSPAGYLMSDGTILNNSGDGVNSNIYLYNNNNTHTPIPSTGQIRFNQPANADTTQLYISHRTRDAIDIEDPFLSSISTLSIIYIQDQDISENYIRFNVTTPPVIFPTSYVQLNVTFLDGGGNGLTNFGAGMNIFMSIFSNDVEINTRLSNLETKTQNIEATSSKLTVSRSTELLIDDNDFLAIRSIDAFLNYLILTPTEMNLYTDFNLNANALENVGSIKISGFETSNFFLKSDGTLDENDYLQATDSVITNLQNKTQLISAENIGTRTVLSKSSECRLTNLDNFSITLLEGLDNITKFVISGVLINSQIPMTMTNNRLYGIPTPTNDDDCANKLYVDNSVSSVTTNIQNITSTSTSTNILHNIVNTLEFGESFKIQDDTLSPIIEINNTDINYYRNQNLNATQIINAGPIEATSFTKIGGSSFQFLKADGSVTEPVNAVGERLNNLYYNVSTGNTTFSINMDSWRYMSWGYVAPTTVSVVDCVTTLMTHQGGSLGILGINAGIPAKGYKIRVGSNVGATANGSTCGWLGAAVQNFIVPRGGWYIKIGFSLDATTGAGNNRTMIGLFQSNTRPVLDNTTTIASVVTGSMGIVQEKGETVFSFNTRGPSGSTKIATTISCETPNNNWYILEMINEPRFTRVTLILTSQTDVDTKTATTSFICGQANTMALATAWVHLQQSMASPGGINNSAGLALGNITMKMAQ